MNEPTRRNFLIASGAGAAAVGMAAAVPGVAGARHAGCDISHPAVTTPPT